MPRSQTLPILVAVSAALGSCGGNQQLCTSCPAVAGTYDVILDTSSGTLSNDCQTSGLGPPSGALFITQAAAILKGSYAGFSLNGRLYDTYDMTLNGIGSADGGPTGGDSLSIHGRFVPSYPDGGQLKGNLNAVYQRGQRTCSEYEPLTATQQ